MTHLRKTLRDEAVTAVTGLATTGANVFSSRIFPLAQTELPALVVYAAQEEVEPAGNTLLRRFVTLSVKGYARAIASVEDTLETIAEEVETAMVLSAFSVAKRIWLAGTEMEFSDEGEAEYAALTLHFQIEYHTQQGAPGASN